MGFGGFYGWRDTGLGDPGSYLLLRQVDWINRRTETVSFEEQGTTHRHIEFDCTMPEGSKQIFWKAADGDAMYAALPVTFFGKGDAVALKVTDGSGAELPVLSSKEGLYCLQLVVCDLLLKEKPRCLAEMCKQRNKTSDDANDKVEVAEPESDMSLGSLLYLYMPAASRNTGGYRNVSLDRWYSSLFRDISRDDPSDDGASTPEEILVFRRHRQTLLRRLFQQLNECSSSDDTILRFDDKERQEGDTRFEEFCTAFSAIINQLAALRMAAERDLEQAGQHCDRNSETYRKARADKRDADACHVLLMRCLLLLSMLCDTYPLLVLVSRDHAVAGKRIIMHVDFETGYQEDLRYKVNPLNQTVDLAFQTYEAAVTQMEISPIPGGTLTDAQERRMELPSREGTPSGDGLSRRKQWEERHDAPLIGRLIAGRLHITARQSHRLPICRLRLKIMHSRDVLASFGLWTLLLMVLNLVTFGCMLSFRQWHPAKDGVRAVVEQYIPWGDLKLGMSIISLYRPENALAAMAVVLALWVARRISTVRHAMVEGLSTATNTALNIDLLITIVNYVLASAGVYADGDNVVRLDGAWSSAMLLRTVATLTAISIAVCGFGAVLWVMYCRRKLKKTTFSVRWCKDPNISQQYDPDGIMPSDRSPFFLLEGLSYKNRSNILKSI